MFEKDCERGEEEAEGGHDMLGIHLNRLLEEHHGRKPTREEVEHADKSKNGWELLYLVRRNNNTLFPSLR